MDSDSLKLEDNIDKSLLTKSKQNEIIISEEDLKCILNILIVLSKRGAFQIDEYKIVGNLFHGLKNILPS